VLLIKRYPVAALVAHRDLRTGYVEKDREPTVATYGHVKFMISLPSAPCQSVGKCLTFYTGLEISRYRSSRDNWMKNSELF